MVDAHGTLLMENGDVTTRANRDFVCQAGGELASVGSSKRRGDHVQPSSPYKRIFL
jgi:hypothetical protein